MILFVLASLCLIATSLLLSVRMGARGRVETVGATLAFVALIPTLLFKALLFLGVFRPGVVAASTAGLLVLSALPPSSPLQSEALRNLRQALFGRPSAELLRSRLSWVFGAIGVLTYGYRALMAVRLPPLDIDSLEYHLVSVSGWVQTGKFGSPIDHMTKTGNLGWLVVSDSYPRDYELDISWFAVFTHNTRLTGLAQIFFALLLFVCTYGLCRKFGARADLSFLASTAAVLVPAAVAQANMNYSDITRAAIPVAAFYMLTIAFPSDERPRFWFTVRWLAFAGALFGFGMGVKSANVYMVPLGIIGALVLRGVGRTADSPSRRGRGPGWLATVLAVGIPASVLGSFWYLVSWRKWGSPVYPISMGPFKGPMTMFDLIDGQRPSTYRDYPTPVVVLQSWFDALPKAGHAFWYADWTGQLGVVWLLFFVPAVIVLIRRALIQRQHQRALYGVVLPLLAGAFGSPGPWFSRYTLPCVTAGAVAFALVCTSQRFTLDTGERTGAAAKIHTVFRQIFTPARELVLGAMAVAMVVGLIGATANSNYFPLEDSANRTLGKQAQSLLDSPAERANTGLWGKYPNLANIPDGTRIGFCAEGTPVNWNPLLIIGARFQHRLVDVGYCGTVSQAKERMQKYGVTYLYQNDFSSVGVELKNNGARWGFREYNTHANPDNAKNLRIYHIVQG